MLEGRRAVVTGASRGIGKAIARALDAAGARVAGVARDAAALAVVAREGRHTFPLAADLATDDGLASVAPRATELLGGAPDILVNNAGAFVIADLVHTTDRDIEQALALNIKAPFRLMRELLPAMRAAGTGHIVTIGSIADRLTLEGNAAYAASKHGARALHEVARDELEGTGVRCSLVAPAATDTSLWDPIDPDRKPGFTPRAQMLRPEDVADAVLWVLTRDARVNIDELRLSHT